jgi:hypothetical protein
MALVLSIGSDPSLMLTRQLLLEQDGHTVVGVMDEKALASACELHTFDVAVLSNALSTNMKQHVVSLIRGHCLRLRYWNYILLPTDGHSTTQTYGSKCQATGRVNLPLEWQNLPRKRDEHWKALSDA